MAYRDLSLLERHAVIRECVANGIHRLSDIEAVYNAAQQPANEFADGGSIHIAPSKRGTFTAAATKHGKSVQAFASQVLAHPENYSPAMRKKANFARNAAHWHEEGGENNNNRLQDAEQLSWIENWLNSRKDIMARNIETEYGNQVPVYTPKNNTGDVREAGFTADYNYPPYNPLYWLLGQNPRIKQAEKVIEREVQNIKNVPVANVGNANRPSYGTLGVYVEPSSFNNTGNYIAFNGIPKDEVKVHEFTHASNPRPQEYYIANVVFKDKNIPQSVPGSTKNEQAKELYGALQEVRYKSGLTPDVIVDEKWIEENKEAFKNTYLENLPKETLITLFNDVAYAPMQGERQINIASLGGHLVHQHGFGDWLNRIFGLQEETQPTDTIPQEPLTRGMDYRELRQRQAYTESKFDNNAKSSAGAVGIFQVTPNVLSDYNKANKTEYKVEDLTDQVINSAVRDWQMQALMQRPWVTAGGANDSIQFAKALSGYNWGSTNTVNALNKAKADGVDIYNGWEWLSYLPKETQDYINFILRGQDNSIMRNDSAYHARIKARPDEVALLNEMKTGGPLYPFSFSKRGLPLVRY